MTATVRPPRLEAVEHPAYRLIARWAYLGVLTFFAFHSSLASIVATTRGGGLGGYVWTVPLAAILTAIGVSRRHRTELPIHDRQTDVIVGVMGLVFAVLLHAVLLHRYALYFHLLRLDLVAMWWFVISSAVVLFGLRPVIRFAWVWGLLAMIFPLPYYLLVIFLGGGRVAAGVGTMVIAGVATGIATGRHFRRGLLGSLFAWGIGLSILAVMAVFLPGAPLLAYQLIPSITSICVAGMALFLGARRGMPKRVLDRKVEPLAARQAWAALPLVLVVAIALSLVRLPTLALAPVAHVDGLRFDTAPAAPPGWRAAGVSEYDWVTRLFGSQARMLRQKMVSENGDVRFDKLGRPRTLVVDTTVTGRPFSFNVYPARVLYHIEDIRLSAARQIDLGYGVEADLFTAVDDDLLVTWDALQWTWRNGQMAQRVLVIAVDNHDDDAPFPQPTGGVLATLNSMFTVLFRGNAAQTDRDPVFKDSELLRDFGHALVRAQLEPLGVKP